MAPHRVHERAGASEERALVGVVTAIPGAVIQPGTAQHHTLGYGDGASACGAAASIIVRTDLPVTRIAEAAGNQGLPLLDVEAVAPHQVRVRTLRAFGYNPFDWACWQ